MTTGAVLAGVDEVGRGCIAGPVVAGACVLPDELEMRKRAGDPPWWEPKGTKGVRLADSKALSPDEREAAAGWIRAHCPFALGWSTAAEVDALGILGATEKAMQEAVAALRAQLELTALLVDGKDKFWFDLPHISVVRGDQSEPAIAAASIVAKVARDEWISDQALTYPGYGFADHKGYGTPDHQAALKQFG
nr:ribonuclease HII [Candidatus Peribacteraceae bacterium]